MRRVKMEEGWLEMIKDAVCMYGNITVNPINIYN
jgi:hypothetical protein